MLAGGLFLDTMTPRTRDSSRAKLALVASLVVLAGVATAWVLWGQSADKDRDGHRQQDVASLAEQWLSAVAAGDTRTSIALAEAICHGRPADAVDPQYATLAESSGVKPAFFKLAFNRWDFQSWHHALFFHQLAHDLTSGKEDKVKALQAAVIERVKPQERKDPQVPWPYRVWQRGFGVCDRQAWVLCELAYQLGWEVQVVYLRDPQTKVSPHTVCELRKGESVWFADPFRKSLHPQRSIDDVADDEALLLQMWPDRADVRRAFQGCVFWTPACPQDYCTRNQELHRRLAAVLGRRCPRFGEDPRLRLEAYRKLRESTLREAPRFPMRLWRLPFQYLNVQGRAFAKRR